MVKAFRVADKFDKFNEQWQPKIHVRGQEPVILKEGGMAIVPAGVEHKPEAKEEAWIMMIEPKTTVNTGNRTESDRTVAEPEWV